jgi:hypothetical protein
VELRRQLQELSKGKDFALSSQQEQLSTFQACLLSVSSRAREASEAGDVALLVAHTDITATFAAIKLQPPPLLPQEDAELQENVAARLSSLAGELRAEQAMTLSCWQSGGSWSARPCSLPTRASNSLLEVFPPGWCDSPAAGAQAITSSATDLPAAGGAQRHRGELAGLAGPVAGPLGGIRHGGGGPWRGVRAACGRFRRRRPRKPLEGMRGDGLPGKPRRAGGSGIRCNGFA